MSLSAFRLQKYPYSYVAFLSTKNEVKGGEHNLLLIQRASQLSEKNRLMPPSVTG